MTRVTDEDLAYVKEHLDLSASEYAKVDAVIAELLALRKVADSAVKYHQADVDSESQPYDDMVAALIEAGAL